MSLSGSGTFACQRVEAPSAVDFSLHAAFTAPHHTNLVLAKSSVLEIYLVDQDVELGCNMSLHTTVKLFGVIESVQKVRFAGHRCDSLILAFLDAKVSIIEFDPSIQDVVTVGMYSLDHKAHSSAVFSHISTPQIRVDPLMRCAAVRFFNHLLVLPFSLSRNDFASAVLLPPTVQPSKVEEEAKLEFFKSDVLELCRHPQINSPLLVDLSSFHSFKDFCFLSGYSEPSVLVMHEPKPTWAGRYASQQLSTLLTTLSLNVSLDPSAERQSNFHIVHESKPVPHDAFQLLPLPDPVGGALVVCVNMIVHVNQSFSCGLRLNEFADKKDEPYLNSTAHHGIPMHLSNACIAMLDSTRFLVATSSGMIYLLSLRIASGSVRSLHLFPATSTGGPLATLCALSSHCVFLGSRIAESLLVELKTSVECDQYLAQHGKQWGAGSLHSPTESKKRKLEDTEMSDDNMADVKTEENVAAAEDDNEFALPPMERALFDIDHSQTLLYSGDAATLGAMNNLRPSFSMSDDLAVDEVTKLANWMSQQHFAHGSVPISVGLPDCGHRFMVRSVLPSLSPASHVLALPQTKVGDDGVEVQTDFVDTIVATGYGAGSALTVMHEGVRETVRSVTQTPAAVEACWAVLARDDDSDAIDAFHAFVVLSLASGEQTLVLSSGADSLAELDSEFFVDGHTLLVASMCEQRRIVQVYADGVRLLRREKQVAQWTAASMSDKKQTIVSAVACDPFVSLLMSDGSVTLLTVSLSSFHSSPALLVPNEFGTIASVALFRHYDPYGSPSASVLAGAFRARDAATPLSEFETVTKSIGRKESMPSIQRSVSVEEEEAMLYGCASNNHDTDQFNPLQAVQSVPLDNDEAVAAFLFGDSNNASTVMAVDSVETAQKIEHHQISDAFVCAIVRSSGVMEIYSIQETGQLDLIYCTPNILSGSRILPNHHNLDSMSVDAADAAKLSVTDLHLIASRSSASLPSFESTIAPRVLLFIALSNGDVMVYQAFKHVTGVAAAPLSFVRIPLDIITRPMTAHAQINAASYSATDASAPCSATHKNRLVPFGNVAGKSGVFVKGLRPCWIELDGTLTSLRVHEHVSHSHAAIECWTEFHAPQCQRGYIYFDHTRRALQIAQLSPAVASEPNQTVSWTAGSRPCHKVAVRDSIRHMERHAPAKAIALICARPVETLSSDEVTSRSMPVLRERHDLRLVSTSSWRVEGTWTELEENEHVVSICSTPLRTREGRVHHTLVLGTSAVEGEDTSARGRLILLDVYKASIMQDENGVEKRVTQLRAQTALSRKEKGPVTALCMIDNTKTGERMMATAVGSRVILYRWVGDKLEGCAFIDTQLYVSSLRSLRDYLVVGDFAKSVALCVYEPELKQIYMLGKDSTGSRGGASVHAVEFLADRDELSVVSSDQGKNLLVFNYSDLNRTLTVRADYHIGSRVNSLLQLRARTAPKHPSEIPESLEGDESVSSGTGAATGSASSRAKALQLANLRHFQLATDLDGGIHRLIPLDDAIFRRLFSLQTQLTLTLEHSAGLNPRAHRLVRVESQLPARLHLPTPPKRNIVDIDLVWRYLSLDVTQQRRLARTIGTQPETIVENLLEFEMAMRLF